MTDSKLRELERRWKETQSVQDEAAYLLERVRVRDLEREKLELAAYCGHDGARRGLGTDAPFSRGPFKEWISGLATWGERVPAVAAHGLAGSALVEFELPYPNVAAPRHCLEALANWAACPCETHDTSIRKAACDITFALQDLGLLDSEDKSAAYHAARVVAKAAEVAFDQEPLQRLSLIPQEWKGEEEARRRMTEHVISWALRMPLGNSLEVPLQSADGSS